MVGTEHWSSLQFTALWLDTCRGCLIYWWLYSGTYALLYSDVTVLKLQLGNSVWFELTTALAFVACTIATHKRVIERRYIYWYNCYMCPSQLKMFNSRYKALSITRCVRITVICTLLLNLDNQLKLLMSFIVHLTAKYHQLVKQTLCMIKTHTVWK